jgi:hypothetical protein
VRQGQWAAAEQAVAEALELARNKRYAIGEVRALQAHAELHVRHGDSQAARGRLEEARALYQQLGAPAEVARLELAIAELSQE